MGGNALMFAHTERKNKEQYTEITRTVIDKLCELFPATEMAAIKSIEGKETFGDCDILLVDKNLPANWIYQVQQAFHTKEMLINRLGGGPLRFIDPNIALEVEHVALHDGSHYDVPQSAIPSSTVSFAFEDFQIDLMITQPEDFEIAQIYYAYNDLGNLMGRIADAMGFKFGWSGLWKNLDEGSETYAKLCVSRDPRPIFELLGYDYDRYLVGFESFENMYEYAASSQWFHSALYQFENRNHKDRVRDEKRASYRGFVAWLEGKPWLNKHTWTRYELGTNPPARVREKEAHLRRALSRHTSFRLSVDIEKRRYVAVKGAKKIWNGEIISKLTGFTGMELGDFMRHCKETTYWEGEFVSFEELLYVRRHAINVPAMVRDRLQHFKRKVDDA